MYTAFLNVDAHFLFYKFTFSALSASVFAETTYTRTLDSLQRAMGKTMSHCGPIYSATSLLLPSFSSVGVISYMDYWLKYSCWEANLLTKNFFFLFEWFNIYVNTNLYKQFSFQFHSVFWLRVCDLCFWFLPPVLLQLSWTPLRPWSPTSSCVPTASSTSAAFMLQLPTPLVSCPLTHTTPQTKLVGEDGLLPPVCHIVSLAVTPSSSLVYLTVTPFRLEAVISLL